MPLTHGLKGWLSGLGISEFITRFLNINLRNYIFIFQILLVKIQEPLLAPNPSPTPHPTPAIKTQK